MLVLQVSTAVLLGSDAFAWMYSGVPGRLEYYMVRISNFLVYMLIDLTLLFFQQYLGHRIFQEEERKNNRWLKAAGAFAIAGVLLVVLSQFTDLYYYFDSENVYHRNPAYILSMALPMSGMAIDMALLIYYRNRMSTGIFLALMSYIIFPAVAAVLQAVHYGGPLISVSVACSVILMYIVATREQNRELAYLAKSREEIAEKLQIASTLNRCVRELSSAKDDDRAINNLLEIINDYFKADRTYIFEIDFDENVLYNTYEYVKDMVSEQIENLQGVPLEVISLWMEKFKQEEPYFISDLEKEKDTPHYEILKEQDISSLLTVALMKDGEVTGFLGVDNPKNHYEDATLLASMQFFVGRSLERKKEKEYLKYLSYRDMLTSLYNRNRYMEMLDTCKMKKMSNVGAAYIDLNGLKQINDLEGHEAGDRQIKGAAAVIKKIFPEESYRIGGDEFVVVVSEIDELKFANKMKQLKEQMKAMQISVSVGFVWKDETDNLEEVLKNADMHMYKEKEAYYSRHDRRSTGCF